MALKEQVPNVYSVGLHNVGSYQVSGRPYLSGSATTATIGSVIQGHYAFPSVSKTITVTNNDSSNDAIVSFAPMLDAEKADYGYNESASGSGNWVLLKAATSIEFDAKCTEVFVSPATAQAVNDITVYAELTNIPVPRMFSLDGLYGVTALSASHPWTPNGLTEQVPNVYSVGVQNVGSYQVSGRPFITGSYLEGAATTVPNSIPVAGDSQILVGLPTVSKSLTVWNRSNDAAAKLRVTFASTGSMTNYPANGCYYELAQNESMTLSVKCKEVYLSAIGAEVQWKLYASLTNIPAKVMYALTGSGISE
jgi:hypothetical protein